MTKQTDIIESGGNVFADLGVTEPGQALAKAELARQISAIIRSRNLSQTKAAQLLGVDQPKVSALVQGRLAGFSMDRLLRFLNALGQDIEVRIRPKVKDTPVIYVSEVQGARFGWNSTGMRVARSARTTSTRDTYKYQFKVGNKIVHSGITNNLERREQEHKQNWPKGQIEQVGRRTTEDAARKWEKDSGAAKKGREGLRKYYK